MLNSQYGYIDDDHDETQLWISSLSLLRNGLTSLTNIQQYGRLAPQVCDMILEHKHIRDLSIRQTDTLSLSRPFLTLKVQTVLSNWQQLMSIQTLQTLDVGRLLSGEASALALAVRQLSKLEVLRIEAAPVPEVISHNTTIGFADDHMPIARLFRFLYYNVPMPLGLPASLRRLTLIDNDHP